MLLPITTSTGTDRRVNLHWLILLFFFLSLFTCMCERINSFNNLDNSFVWNLSLIIVVSRQHFFIIFGKEVQNRPKIIASRNTTWELAPSLATHAAFIVDQLSSYNIMNFPLMRFCPDNENPISETRVLYIFFTVDQ